ncbi:hypothetical protein D915_010481 [Fasciola hepatica]|uniref:Uncharacterized protein n=1 Tax=Fasciola hepatica TaxID=6192 RepID=A0A4E0RA21_FASHE|nr:hypothetical protein D915_010481 [Fasciola hepatica]
MSECEWDGWFRTFLVCCSSIRFSIFRHRFCQDDVRLINLDLLVERVDRMEGFENQALPLLLFLGNHSCAIDFDLMTCLCAVVKNL